MPTLRSIFGRLGPRTELPAQQNRAESAPDTSPRPPRPRSRSGRRCTVEGDEAFTIRLLKGLRRISPARDYVLVELDGHEWRVVIDWRPRHFGGWQAYFRCSDCGQRRTALFRSNEPVTRPVCRGCAGLIHRSEALTNPARRRKRMLKIQKRLGLPGDVVLDRLTRPKGMRRSVFFLQEARWFAARSKLKVRELHRKYKRRKTRPLIAI